MKLALDYVGRIESDTMALAAAAAVGMDVLVPTGDGWQVRDLAWHVREVQWMWAHVVRHLLTGPPDFDQSPRRPDTDAELLQDLRRGSAELVDVFAAADPDAACWTWSAQREVSVVIRHQYQETALHRWDVENALGRDYVQNPVFASDAVTEFLENSTDVVAAGSSPLPGPVRLEAVDADHAWTVAEDERRALSVVSAAAPWVTQVRGRASDLLLGLYRRVGDERFDITGDAAGWPALVERADLD